jgi:hypothetical protein
MNVWIKRALVVAIALTLVNDGGRYLQAVYRIDERTRAMAFEAGRIARQDPSANSGWPTVQKMAAEAGLEVLGYAQSPQDATVVTRIHVIGTWALGPIKALISRQPLSTPFPIDRRATGGG